jgi:hypothetical protein
MVLDSKCFSLCNLLYFLFHSSLSFFLPNERFTNITESLLNHSNSLKFSILDVQQLSCTLTFVCVSRWILRDDFIAKHFSQIGHLCAATQMRVEVLMAVEDVNGSLLG